MNSPHQVKRPRRLPPAPGSPAFEQLPAVSVPFVVYVFFYSYTHLFDCALSDPRGNTILENNNKSPSPVFGTSTPRYVSFYTDPLVDAHSSLLKAGLGS